MKDASTDEMEVRTQTGGYSDPPELPFRYEMGPVMLAIVLTILCGISGLLLLFLWLVTL